MTIYKFQYIYTDGSIKYKYFTTKQAGIMWSHNEGDHLLEYDYITVKVSDCETGRS